MINKKIFKKGKKVFYAFTGQWSNPTEATIREVISPNKYDDFLVLECKTGRSHLGNIPAIHMEIIDPHNDTVVPVNKHTKVMIDRLIEENTYRTENLNDLEKVWLEVMDAD